mgnify:FL=1
MTTLRQKVLSYARQCHDGDTTGLLAEIQSNGDTDVAHILNRSFLKGVFDCTNRPKLLNFLRRKVWTDSLKNLFWSECPLERFCLSCMETLDVSSLVIMRESLNHGVRSDRMACCFHSIITKHMANLKDEEFIPACNVLEFLIQNEIGRAHV